MWKAVPAVFTSVMRYHIRKVGAVSVQACLLVTSCHTLSGGYGTCCRAALCHMDLTQHTHLLPKSLSSLAGVSNL